MSATVAVRRLRPRALGAALVPGARLRRRTLAIVALAAALAAGYLLWLRDSGVVAVEQVRVTGLEGIDDRDAARVRSALEAAARDMTTLHVDRGALERTVAAYPFVRAVEARPDFPHGLRIHVVEHRPAAVLSSHGRRVLVAGDGSILTGLALKGSLPEIRLQGALPPRRLGAGAVLDSVRVAGAAPAALAGRLKLIERDGDRGVVARLADGPDLIFGQAERIGAKWAAAARVLADPDAAGADYVDVRIPERPAAGGLPVGTVDPVAPAGSAGSPAGPGGAQLAPPAPAPGVAQEAPAPAEPAPQAAAPAPVQPQPPAGSGSAPGAGGGAAANPQP